MTDHLSPAALDALLSQTRRAFENLRPSQGASPEGHSEPARGEGTALDERVRAVVVAPGRVEELTMDPRVLREGSEVVCEAIIEAVNAALDDLRSQVMAEAGAFDLERMRDDLERLQAESLETARTLFGAVHEAMARIERNR